MKISSYCNLILDYIGDNPKLSCYISTPKNIWINIAIPLNILFSFSFIARDLHYHLWIKKLACGAHDDFAVDPFYSVLPCGAYIAPHYALSAKVEFAPRVEPTFKHGGRRSNDEFRKMLVADKSREGRGLTTIS